jgi:quercetin dioxygenase-like cupin family protein
MQRWVLDAERASGRTGPRVLFSTPDVRGVVIDLASDEAMGDHVVHERAVIQVLRGEVHVTTGESTEACPAGTLILFEPKERHAIRAAEASQLLLILAPWPAPGHYRPEEQEDPHALPVNATMKPA